MFNILIGVVFSVVVGVTPQVSYAAAWQITGSGCVIHNGTRPVATGNVIQFSTGEVGTIRAYCPVTTVDVDGAPYNLGVYFQDKDGAGASKITVGVYRMDKRAGNNGAESLVCSFDSNVEGNGADANWQVSTKSCITSGNPADQNTYLYYGIVTLTRSTTTPFPMFYGMELF